MKSLTKGKKLLSLVLAMVMMLSVMCVSASAAVDVSSKDLYNLVEITQNGTKSVIEHDYNKANDKPINVDYVATLKMTKEMAEMLTARNTQLYDAKFTVNVEFSGDYDALEFVTAGEQEITFTSTFLKPKMDADKYTVTKSGNEYKFKFNIEQPTGSTLEIPMELIAVAKDGKVYGYEEAVKACPDEPLMFAGYTVADWQKEIKIETAKMVSTEQAKNEVKTAESTWKHIFASGTIDGNFSYVKLHPITKVGDVDGTLASFKAGTVDFSGGWESNKTELILKRTSSSVPVIIPVEPPLLNTKDHFAYVIGYPDGMVKPQGNVTRAEVATIFFRMLKDEARDKYWSTTNNYTDIKATDWFNNAISTLSNMGIINGYPDGTFRPNAGITRAEFAKIAVSFFQDNSRKTLGDLFSDISGQWYTEYVNLASELAIVNGYPDGTFRPNNLITRAEAMTIVNNTLRRTPHKEGLLPRKDMITWPDNPENAWFYEAVQEATNSHEYQRASTVDKEQWTKPLPVRDWAAFEKAWANSNAAANPGDVVDGQNGYLLP